MTPVAEIGLYLWPLVVIWLFTRLPPRQAVLAAVVAGWLLLPVTGQVAVGFRWGKAQAVAVSAVMASLMFDPNRLLSVRPRWFDVPMLVWLVCSFATVASNDLPWWDGMSQCAALVALWGLPYWLGRAYLADAAGMRDYAVAVVIGAALYVPLCLYEIRMSPQLHAMVWGFAQHDFFQTLRYGGYRPMVFLQHGLMLAFWMVAGAVTAFWLWRSRAVPGIPVVPGLAPRALLEVVLVLAVTTVLCKSAGALALGMAGGVVLLVCRRSLLAVPLLVVLIAAGPAYVIARSSGAWTGESLIRWVADNVDRDRAESMEFRFVNENRLLEKIHERPVWGWGGRGRGMESDPDDPTPIIVDGFWIITLNIRGYVGLAAAMTVMLLPVVRFVRMYPPWQWQSPIVAPAAASAVVLLLYMIDCLPNGMVNPVFMLAAGGLAGLTATTLRRPATIIRLTATAPGQPPALPAPRGASPVRRAAPPPRILRRLAPRRLQSRLPMSRH